MNTDPRKVTQAAATLIDRLGTSAVAVLEKPSLVLPHETDQVVPDLAGWNHVHLESSRFEEEAPYRCPDWVCEIIAGQRNATVRSERMKIYRRQGVGFVWLLSVELELLEVFRLERERWTLVETYLGDVEVHAEPFEAIALPLGALWAK